MSAPTVGSLQAGPTVPFVRLNDADSFDELLGVVADVARSGAFTMGAHLTRFEVDFARYCETAHAIGVSSGTAALALTLRALGVGPGDDVVVPANSFIATAEAVSAAGATPRFADVDPHTHLLTADAAQAAWTPNVRCVIPVHLYGRTVDMESITALARGAGAFVVEDACQAHGARYRGRRVGSMGDAGCFSFYPTKNLGAWGDGGAVVTDDPALADRIRLLRSHGERPRYNHRVVGGTERLHAIQAAVLRVKLRGLDDANERRRKAGAALYAALDGAPVTRPAVLSPSEDHVFHLFVVCTEERDALRARLELAGVDSAIHYPTPIHLTEAYAHLGYEPGSLPTVEWLSSQICSLPMFPGINESEIAAVAGAVKEEVFA